MKFEELKEMTTAELREKIVALEKQMFEARLQFATHQLTDTALFRRLRHQVAQIKTVLRTKEVQGEKAHA